MYSSIDFVSLGEIVKSFIDRSNAEMMLILPDAKTDDIADIVLKYVKEQDNLMWMIARHFSEQPTFSACLPSGGIVRLSADFLLIRICKGNWAFHPALDEGSLFIGTDKIEREILYLRDNIDYDKTDDVIRLSRLEAFERRYRPLSGGSIQVSQRHAPRSPEDLNNDNSPLQTSDRDIIGEIISLSDRGLRRDDIKNRICPSLPIEAWRALWREAAKIEPGLSKSGPKPRSSVRN